MRVMNHREVCGHCHQALCTCHKPNTMREELDLLRKDVEGLKEMYRAIKDSVDNVLLLSGDEQFQPDANPKLLKIISSLRGFFKKE